MEMENITSIEYKRVVNDLLSDLQLKKRGATWVEAERRIIELLADIEIPLLAQLPEGIPDALVDEIISVVQQTAQQAVISEGKRLGIALFKIMRSAQSGFPGNT